MGSHGDPLVGVVIGQTGVKSAAVLGAVLVPSPLMGETTGPGPPLMASPESKVSPASTTAPCAAPASTTITTTPASTRGVRPPPEEGITDWGRGLLHPGTLQSGICAGASISGTAPHDGPSQRHRRRHSQPRCCNAHRRRNSRTRRTARSNSSPLRPGCCPREVRQAEPDHDAVSGAERTSWEARPLVARGPFMTCHPLGVPRECAADAALPI